MLTLDNTAVVLIDVQGKLAQRMDDKETRFDNMVRLIAAAKVLDLPIVWVEQNPEKMGPTIAPLRDLLTDHTPIPKMSFGCVPCPAFMDALQATGRRQVLMAGIETHVCVYQTAAQLVEAGYHAEVAADAISSRTALRREIGFEKIKTCGAAITCVETALFEMLHTAAHPAFRDILRIVK